jgi:hypothetical protein
MGRFKKVAAYTRGDRLSPSLTLCDASDGEKYMYSKNEFSKKHSYSKNEFSKKYQYSKNMFSKKY